MNRASNEYRAIFLALTANSSCTDRSSRHCLYPAQSIRVSQPSSQADPSPMTSGHIDRSITAWSQPNCCSLFRKVRTDSETYSSLNTMNRKLDEDSSAISWILCFPNQTDWILIETVWKNGRTPPLKRMMSLVGGVVSPVSAPQCYSAAANKYDLLSRFKDGFFTYDSEGRWYLRRNFERGEGRRWLVTVINLMWAGWIYAIIYVIIRNSKFDW